MEDLAASDPEGLLRLTLRILEHFRIVGQERPKLLPGQLPENLAFEVPLSLDAVLVGSQIYEDRAMNIYIDMSIRPDEAIDFYDQVFTQMGWKAQQYEASEPFATIEEEFGENDEGDWPDDTDSYISSDELLTASVSALTTEEGITSVALYIGSREERHEDPEEAAAARMVQLLPQLPPPTGVEEWEVSFSGGPDNAERRMDVAADLAMTHLTAHYDREIAAEGWKRTDGEVTMRSSWSAWEREDESGERLYLVWFAFRIPTSTPVYTVVEQVGTQQRGLPAWSYGAYRG